MIVILEKVNHKAKKKKKYYKNINHVACLQEILFSHKYRII